MEKNSIGLAACPFCAGKRHEIGSSLSGPGMVITCSYCTGRIWGQTEAEAIAVWNRRTPGPATTAMVAAVKRELRGFPESDLIPVPCEVLAAFLAEWSESAAASVPEQPAPSSPWECALCGRPISVADDLQPYHTDPAMNQLHGAMLSDADKKVLADGLGLKGYKRGPSPVPSGDGS